MTFRTIKNILKGFSLGLLFCTLIRAERPTRLFPNAQTFNLPAPYVSSCTCVNTGTTSPIISTHAAVIRDILIISTGATATLDIYNGISTTTANKLMGPIDATSRFAMTGLSIAVSSMITIDNKGVVPACIVIGYNEADVKR